jgi:hypothetical protein
MSPEIVGILGILLMFILMALRMYIGIAMSIAGFLGLAYLIGIDSAMGVLGITPLLRDLHTH